MGNCVGSKERIPDDPNQPITGTNDRRSGRPTVGGSGGSVGQRASGPSQKGGAGAVVGASGDEPARQATAVVMAVLPSFHAELDMLKLAAVDKLEWAAFVGTLVTYLRRALNTSHDAASAAVEDVMTRQGLTRQRPGAIFKAREEASAAGLSSSFKGQASPQPFPNGANGASGGGAHSGSPGGAAANGGTGARGSRTPPPSLANGSSLVPVDERLTKQLESWVATVGTVTEAPPKLVPELCARLAVGPMPSDRRCTFGALTSWCVAWCGTPALRHLFLQATGGAEFMTAAQFMAALETMNDSIDLTKACATIDSSFGGSMTWRRFACYFGSLSSNSSVDPRRAFDPWQDMSSPLPNYLVHTRSVASRAQLDEGLQANARCLIFHPCLATGSTGAVGVSLSGPSGGLSLAEAARTIRERGFSFNEMPIVIACPPRPALPLDVQEAVADTLTKELGPLIARGPMFDGAMVTDPHFSPTALQRKVIVLAPQAPLRPFVGLFVADMQREGLGVRVTDIKAGSPAAKAGCQRMDWITHIDGAEVRNVAGFRLALGQLHLGDAVTLRKDNLVDLKLVVGGAVDTRDKRYCQSLSELVFLRFGDTSRHSSPGHATPLTGAPSYGQFHTREPDDDSAVASGGQAAVTQSTSGHMDPHRAPAPASPLSGAGRSKGARVAKAGSLAPKATPVSPPPLAASPGHPAVIREWETVALTTQDVLHGAEFGRFAFLEHNWDAAGRGEAAGAGSEEHIVAQADAAGAQFVDVQASAVAKRWAEGKFGENGQCGYVLRDMIVSDAPYEPVRIEVTVLSRPQTVEAASAPGADAPTEPATLSARVYGETPVLGAKGTVAVDVVAPQAVLVISMDFGAGAVFEAACPALLLRDGCHMLGVIPVGANATAGAAAATAVANASPAPAPVGMSRGAGRSPPPPPQAGRAGSSAVLVRVHKVRLGSSGAPSGEPRSRSPASIEP